jgi:hypothetical protein
MEQIWNNQMLKGSILSSYETTERDETAPLAPRCTVHLDLAGGSVIDAVDRHPLPPVIRSL